jgi:hypothetical protein
MSFINFDCYADKTGFTRFLQNQSVRPLFFDKVDFNIFEIFLKIECLHDGLVQEVDSFGCVQMKGEFSHNEDCSFTHMYLSSKINNKNWIRLKSDLLLSRGSEINLEIFNINFINLHKDDESKGLSSNLEASFQSYSINKILN